MTRICLLVLVGLPAAGKTSFCHWLLNTQQENFKILHFCYDNFFDIEQFLQPAAAMSEIYKAQRQKIFETLETVIHSISNGKDIPTAMKSQIGISENEAKDDFIILLDDNNYYRSMRYKVYQFCKRKALGFGQIYFDCDQETSLVNNTLRSFGHLPNAVIEKMAKRFEVPSKIHHWEVTTLKINCKNYDNMVKCIFNFVSKAFNNVPKNDVHIPVENQTEISLLHSLDILLRRRIAQLLSFVVCKDTKRTRAAQLNEQRKEILRQYRDFNLIEDRLSEIVDLLDDNKNFEI